MSKKLLILCVAAASLGLSVTSEAQKPDADKGAHQQMMQGMTEAEFVPMMIKHHQDGIQMAQLEEKNGASAEVKALAAKIRQSQERDIPELKKHSQHASATAASGNAGHDKMMEQQSQITMKRLKTASGAALDHAFLEEMAKHHQMAISMTEGTKFQNAELRQFAQKMAAGQRQELAELKKHLAAHGPK